MHDATIRCTVNLQIRVGVRHLACKGEGNFQRSRQMHDTNGTSYISSGEHLQDQGTQKHLRKLAVMNKKQP